MLEYHIVIAVFSCPTLSRATSNAGLKKNSSFPLSGLFFLFLFLSLSFSTCNLCGDLKFRCFLHGQYPTGSKMAKDHRYFQFAKWIKEAKAFQSIFVCTFFTMLAKNCLQRGQQHTVCVPFASSGFFLSATISVDITHRFIVTYIVQKCWHFASPPNSNVLEPFGGRKRVRARSTFSVP